MSSDDLGDRMKSYETAEDRRFDPMQPIYARIDGRAFSRFTRGMQRPFDPGMADAMAATTSGLVERTHARLGYTQSDEISLVWLAEDECSQVFFDGRVQKLASVLAALATVLFNDAIRRDPRMGAYVDRLPHFDCRVIQLPSRSEAANMFLWRELDAYRNAVSMVAQANFSHRSLQGQGRADQLAMLAAAGVDFEGYPDRHKRGLFLRRRVIEHPLDECERMAIPEKHRPAPGTMFQRSEIAPIDMPPFVQVANRDGVVFDGEEPRVRQLEMST